MAPNSNSVSCDQEARDEAVLVIRSLVIIKKGLTTLREISSEYRDMEGEQIPFKQFGFRSAEDFLRSSGQFNLTPSNGEVLFPYWFH